MDIPDELLDADPITRARWAGELAARYGDVITELSRIRREALTELESQGLSKAEIGRQIGITRSRVSQLLGTGPRPERALLARGAVTVAIGGKYEGRQDKAHPSAVVSRESLGAYNILRDLCEAHMLSSTYEVVPPPGLVDLNRDNLIVIGSPRLLPLVGQALGADKNLAWRHGGRGWYLVDQTTETIYRSPADAGEPADYAYIGRLPRPDGKGSFLYLAGIHAMGTLGAAHHIADKLEAIYHQVRTGRWSALVRVDYDPDSRTVTGTTTATEIYA